MSRDQDTRRVSEAYRGIARETPPAKLDESVMAMARQEARTRYGLARAWIRPVAWAATIALSFAFILELTYFSGGPPIDAPHPAGPEADIGQYEEPAAKEAPYKRPPATIVATPEIRASEPPPLQRAEERAGATAAGLADDVAADEFRRQRAPAAVASEIGHCDAGDRENADTWYRCILALRDSGLDAAAELELDALQRAFPDFREPVSE